MFWSSRSRSVRPQKPLGKIIINRAYLYLCLWRQNDNAFVKIGWKLSYHSVRTTRYCMHVVYTRVLCKTLGSCIESVTRTSTPWIVIKEYCTLYFVLTVVTLPSIFYSNIQSGGYGNILFYTIAIFIWRMQRWVLAIRFPQSLYQCGEIAEDNIVCT